jgi:hypothetical protein
VFRDVPIQSFARLFDPEFQRAILRRTNPFEGSDSLIHFQQQQAFFFTHGDWLQHPNEARGSQDQLE